MEEIKQLLEKNFNRIYQEFEDSKRQLQEHERKEWELLEKIQERINKSDALLESLKHDYKNDIQSMQKSFNFIYLVLGILIFGMFVLFVS